jgi:hypothetical protein
MRRVLVPAAALWICAGMQQALAPRLGFGEVQPDFILATIAPLALLLPRPWATLVGFAGGALHGLLAGANLASYAISRTVSGFVVASFGVDPGTATPTAALFATVGATVVAGLLHMFIAPPPAIGAFLTATIAGAIYNGVVAVPLYLALRKLMGLAPVR